MPKPTQTTEDNTMELFFIFLAVIALIIFAPYVTILALNTLFGLTIQFTFWTWLSVTWLGVFCRGVSVKRNS